MIRALGHDLTLDTVGPGTRIRFTLPVPAVAAAVEAVRSDPSVPTACSVELRTGRRADGTLVLHLGGDIDLSTIDARRGELFEQIRHHPGDIVLDTGDVSYLASAGVGLLMEAIGMAPERVRLHVSPGSPAARILAVTGLDSVVVGR